MNSVQILIDSALVLYVLIVFIIILLNVFYM